MATLKLYLHAKPLHHQFSHSKPVNIIVRMAMKIISLVTHTTSMHMYDPELHKSVARTVVYAFGCS